MSLKAMNYHKSAVKDHFYTLQKFFVLSEPHSFLPGEMYAFIILIGLILPARVFLSFILGVTDLYFSAFDRVLFFLSFSCMPVFLYHYSACYQTEQIVALHTLKGKIRRQL